MNVDKRWAAQCVALFFPFTAAFHHAYFVSPTCMLNPIGPDYTPATLAKLVLQDPSIGWGCFAALVTYLLGFNAVLGRLVRAGAIPLFIGFLPLSLWVWDIPFAGRPICMHWHDGKLVLPVIGHLRGTYLYWFGIAITLLGTALRALPARTPPPLPRLTVR